MFDILESEKYIVHNDKFIIISKTSPKYVIIHLA